MIDMDYNTQLPELIMLEHGRNTQKMIDHACTIQDRETRNSAAKAIIDVMGQLNPHLRDVPDFKHKLWDHLFIMSDFKLDVDSPYPIPARETFTSKPELMKYPARPIKYKHYGRNMELLINKAVATEDPQQKEEFKQVLAHHMKKSYLTWNRDSVGDETIAKQLIELSNGKLVLDDTFKFQHTSDILVKNKINTTPINNNNRNDKNRKKFKFKKRTN